MKGAMEAAALLVVSLAVAVIFSSPAAAASPVQWGKLDPHFYDHSCPQAQQIVASIVGKAHYQDPRMAASLLRLHFHDCFVKGCDASLLLDSSGSIVSEKRSNPNRDSARGFEVIDEIKAALEAACPGTVSCADILALAARDSTVMTGGPGWIVPLGRRDARGASVQGSNNDIPAPNNTLPTIITKFKLQGLDIVDLVALLGSHTIGDSRCTSFRQRLYNQTGNGLPDFTLDASYAASLRPRCPRSGGDQNLFFLDPSGGASVGAGGAQAPPTPRNSIEAIEKEEGEGGREEEERGGWRKKKGKEPPQPSKSGSAPARPRHALQVRQPVLQEHPRPPRPARLRRGAPHRKLRHRWPCQALRRRPGRLLPALRAVHGQDGQHLAAHRGRRRDQEALQEGQPQLIIVAVDLLHWFRLQRRLGNLIDRVLRIFAYFAS
ncbi:unnamed protein product [Urochloa humidicola]